jgi:hypothetical protein
LPSTILLVSASDPDYVNDTVWFYIDQQYDPGF